jgi:glutamate racemase
VHLVGSPRLATYAEAEFGGTPVADRAIAGEIASCFIEKDGLRTDTIVLACTHYPLLLERFRAGARWSVTWLDPAPAIARRVADLMRTRAPGNPPPPPHITFTSGRAPSPQLATALARYGF